MKTETCFGVLFCFVATAIGETSEEAYARLSMCKSIWETNCTAYVDAIRLATTTNAYGANGRWFADFMGFPDFVETNRWFEILKAKCSAVERFSSARGIRESSNAWFAVAEYVGRMRRGSIPGLMSEEWRLFTPGEKNPKPVGRLSTEQDFKEFQKSHPGAGRDDWMKWELMLSDREYRMANVQITALRHVMQDFWWVGTMDYTDEQMAACRSNITERAMLTPAEEKYIFDSYERMPNPLKDGRRTKMLERARRSKIAITGKPVLSMFGEKEIIRPLPTTDEEFKAEFLRLVASSNLLIRRPKEEIGPLCEGIAKLGDKDRALRLLDQLFEMAVAQEVTATEARHRCSWFDRLFVVGGMAFCHAQKLRGNPSERWDELFKFYDRFLDETTKAEEGLPMELEYSQWSESDRSKWSYLTALRSNLGSCNIIILDFYNRHLRKEDTRTLRDDVLERLLEFNKFSEATPFIPKSGKPLARPDFSRWRRSESPRRK